MNNNNNNNNNKAPMKRSRETRRLIDSLGGGIETTTPRSERTTRKVIKQNQNNTTSSSSSTTTTTTTTKTTKTKTKNQELLHKNSDSSLSELSDTFEQTSLKSSHLSSSISATNKPLKSSKTTLNLSPSSFINHSRKKNIIKNNNSSLIKKRKNEKKKSSSINKKSHFSLIRKNNNNLLHQNSIQNQNINNLIIRNQRNRFRKLTESEKIELEKTKIKLLENLKKEEELIRTSQHPILISLEEKVKIGREIKLNQAKKKFNNLLFHLDLLNFERQQRIWNTWIDKKIRLRSEMLTDCQIRLNRAPFEFLISNDTTNLQAIFHLTPAPTAAYNRGKVSVSEAEKGINKGVVAEGTKNTNDKGRQQGSLDNKLNKSTWISEKKKEESRKQKPDQDLIANNNNKTTTTTMMMRKKKLRDNDLPGLHSNLASSTNTFDLLHQDQEKEDDHPRNLQFFDSVDLVNGLLNHKIRNHNVWKLSNHDVNHDLNLIKKISPI